MKERGSVNLFQRFRVVFYRSPRLVHAWPASQARASFSPVKACFRVNTAGQFFFFFYSEQPGAGCHVSFFVTARCSLTAFARELVVL